MKTSAPHEKPKVLPPVFENIRPRMRELDQFGVWAYEEFTDEETGQCWFDKTPINACTGRRASSTNPDTWSTFDQAVKAYARGGYDGLTFFLKPGGGFVGCDTRASQVELAKRLQEVEANFKVPYPTVCF
jgi:primase-polymerase (primpol)-like protein